MITTTIEWHRTSDQLPDDDALVIAADSDGDTFAAFVDGNSWRYADAIPAPTPQFWAHFPAGPEPVTCKPALQVQGAELFARGADARRGRFMLDKMRYQNCGPYSGWTLVSIYPGDDAAAAIDAAMDKERGDE